MRILPICSRHAFLFTEYVEIKSLGLIARMRHIEQDIKVDGCQVNRFNPLFVRCETIHEEEGWSTVAETSPFVIQHWKKDFIDPGLERLGGDDTFWLVDRKKMRERTYLINFGIKSYTWYHEHGSNPLTIGGDAM